MDKARKGDLPRHRTPFRHRSIHGDRHSKGEETKPAQQAYPSENTGCPIVMLRDGRNLELKFAVVCHCRSQPWVHGSV